MERKIESFFKKWQKDIIRKPLILYGPKQVGKTFSTLAYGNKEYKNVIYFNTENNKQLEELFTKEKSTEKLIINMSLISGETILPEDTLIILDNLTSNEIVKGMKLFGSESSKYHLKVCIYKHIKESKI
jgi:predicted AAA+ superfamily ATPase